MEKHLNEVVLINNDSFNLIICNPHGIIFLGVILLVLILYLITMREHIKENCSKGKGQSFTSDN